MVPWETRSPSGAQKPALCPGHIVRENPGEEKTAGGVASCDAAGPGYLWFSFLFVNGGRDLPLYVKGASSFGRVRPRSRGEPSPRQVAVGHLHRSAESSGQVRPPSRGQCAQMQLVAALPAPVHASGNHRCRLGWERNAVEPGGGVAGSPYGRFAGTTLAGAVSSGRSAGRLGLSARAVAVVAEAVVVDAGR